tara:strand:+ start:233 stop:766 length:534 start_codon:yes stop_codon:yes gene_type:complete
MAEKIIVNDIELFKINDFDDYYISKNSDIYNKKFDRFLTPWLNSNGYFVIGLFKNKVQTRKSVHRLIGETFIENDDPMNKTTIDHTNRVRNDNRLENLHWASRQDQEFNKGLKKNNTSGKKGVRINVHNNNIEAHWRENCSGKGKNFSIKKLGYDEAFRLACEYRKSKMLEIYNIIE